jgi:hypothetical protein
MVIALAPVMVLVGEPIRRFFLWRLGRRPLFRAIIQSRIVMALTMPNRWVVERASSLGSGRRRGRGDEGPPPADVREPRRPRPSAPAGAVALAEPETRRRVIPIQKARPGELTEPARRPDRRLRQLADLLRVRLRPQHR